MTSPEERADRPGPRIEAEVNGSYVVTGPLAIVDADGVLHEIPEGKTLRLCRCGHSAKKPYCDDSHRRVDFVSRPRWEAEG